MNLAKSLASHVLQVFGATARIRAARQGSHATCSSTNMLSASKALARMDGIAPWLRPRSGRDKTFGGESWQSPVANQTPAAKSRKAPLARWACGMSALLPRQGVVRREQNASKGIQTRRSADRLAIAREAGPVNLHGKAASWASTPSAAPTWIQVAVSMGMSVERHRVFSLGVTILAFCDVCPSTTAPKHIAIHATSSLVPRVGSDWGVVLATIMSAWSKTHSRSAIPAPPTAARADWARRKCASSIASASGAALKDTSATSRERQADAVRALLLLLNLHPTTARRAGKRPGLRRGRNALLAGNEGAARLGARALSRTHGGPCVCLSTCRAPQAIPARGRLQATLPHPQPRHRLSALSSCRIRASRRPRSTPEQAGWRETGQTGSARACDET